MNKRSYGYLAGMIDGDGGVYIQKSIVNGCDAYQPHLRVANCNLSLMKWLVHHFGGRYIKVSSKGDTPNFGSCVRKKYNNRIDNWQWYQTGNARLGELLGKMVGILKSNSEKALAALELTKLHGKYRASGERDVLFQIAKKHTLRPHSPCKDWEYLAGLIDAEGSFGIVEAQTARGFRPLIRISNDDRFLLDWVFESFQIGTIYDHREGDRIRYTWYYKTIDSAEQEKFILAILPYLIVKREQAKESLRLLRIPEHERTIEVCKQIRNRVIDLNYSFGSVETQTPTAILAKIESELCGDAQIA